MKVYDTFLQDFILGHYYNLVQDKLPGCVTRAATKDTTFGFIFCCHHLDILNHFGTKSSIFSFCNENCKLCITGIINIPILEMRRLRVR